MSECIYYSFTRRSANDSIKEYGISDAFVNIFGIYDDFFSGSSLLVGFAEREFAAINRNISLRDGFNMQ